MFVFMFIGVCFGILSLSPCSRLPGDTFRDSDARLELAFYLRRYIDKNSPLLISKVQKKRLGDFGGYYNNLLLYSLELGQISFFEFLLTYTQYPILECILLKIVEKSCESGSQKIFNLIVERYPFLKRPEKLSIEDLPF